MSFCFNAIVAAKIAVAKPTTATTVIVVGASEYIMLLLAIMYIPAVTIVAACINADTGVGPAIASGSHVYKGICALLPIAPTKSNNVMPVNVAVLTEELIIPLLKRSSKETVPKAF